LQRASKEQSSPFENVEEDDHSHWSHSKQRNQWNNEGSAIEEGDDEDTEAFGAGVPATVLAIDDEPEQIFRAIAPASAQKGTQQLLDYEDKNQSAASSSSKTKQSVGRKSMRSLGP